MSKKTLLAVLEFGDPATRRIPLGRLDPEVIEVISEALRLAGNGKETVTLSFGETTADIMSVQIQKVEPRPLTHKDWEV